jgi:trans-aconitate methyltransferase
MANWFDIWAKRGLSSDEPAEPLASQRTALALNGYDGPTSGSPTLDDWRSYATKWAERTKATPTDSIYEVGSGCGAFLACLQEAIGFEDLAGCDISRGLVNAGASLFPHFALEVADAKSFPTRPRASHVVSFGVFFYFPSHQYAACVLRRMQRKALSTISVLDIPDADRRQEAEAYRRSMWGNEAYERRYEGLDHLYFHRDWFAEQLSSERWSVEICSQDLDNYGNSPHRFNVIARSRLRDGR